MAKTNGVYGAGYHNGYRDGYGDASGNSRQYDLLDALMLLIGTYAVVVVVLQQVAYWATGIGEDTCVLGNCAVLPLVGAYADWMARILMFGAM